MENSKGVVQFICDGGSGGEAHVKVELRTMFPGVGGTILTSEGVATALRQEYNPTTKSGHIVFLRHLIIKKLDDFFFRTGKYVFAHITRPLGSISKEEGETREAYLYEWAFGSEGFMWSLIDSHGERGQVILRDWNHFVACFREAGIDLGYDCTDVDDGNVSKNIIHQYPKSRSEGYEMNSLWKRIDFGSNSIRLDFEKLEKFLRDNKTQLIDKLRYERYGMIRLALKYLKEYPSMSSHYIGKLEVLVGDYRRWSLSHYTSHGPTLSGKASVILGPGPESLLP